MSSIADLRRRTLVRRVYFVLRAAGIAGAVIGSAMATQRHAEMMEALGAINRNLQRLVPPEGKPPA